MQTADGNSILKGVAIGPLRIFKRTEAEIAALSTLTPAEEAARFHAARVTAMEQIQTLYDKALGEVGAADAAILVIHQMMLEDEDYLEAVRRIMEEHGGTAEYAVSAAGREFAAAFAAVEDEYMRARSADVRDVSRRMVNILTNRSDASMQDSRPAILATDDLTPSEMVRLDKSKLLGIITRHGSSSSHTAILARTMNIPALVGVDFDESWDGKMAALDGYAGRLYVDPTEELLTAMEEKLQADRRHMSRLRELMGKSNATLDGREIRVCANIGSVEDVELALRNDAQGIGLFRSEFIYLESEDYPAEERQFSIYRRVVEAMAGKRVVIRTLDIGADKQTAYFGLEGEENPALGYRAIRICLTRPEIFKTQLRAILRASAFGPVSILFPMIISLEEVREAKALLAACRAELKREGVPAGELEIGVMIETPAAVMLAEELAEEADFFSIGTNDLTQYTLALDRQNPSLDRFYDPRHPAVLRMIRHTLEAGHRHGCRVCICGELGSDQTMTETFMRMGIDELSVSPSAILPLRKLIRGLDLSRPQENTGD